MEREPDPPAPPPESKFFKPSPGVPINVNPDYINLSRSFNTFSTCSSTTSSSSSSPPDLVRHIQAAFKRHRPLGMMQSNGIKPRRAVVPQRGTPKGSNHVPTNDQSKEDAPPGDRLRVSEQQSKTAAPATGYNQEDASITPPSEWGSTVNAQNKSIAQRDQSRLHITSGVNDAVTSLGAEPRAAVAEVQRKVHFSSEKLATPCDMEQDVGNQVDTSAAGNEDWQHHNSQNMEIDNGHKTEAGVSSMAARGTISGQEKLHQLENFFQNDLNNGMTQSSVVGSSCVTSTLMHISSAPMTGSTTYSSQPQMGSSHLVLESARGAVAQQSEPSSKISCGAYSHQSAVTSHVTNSNLIHAAEVVDKSSAPSMEVQNSVPDNRKVAADSSYKDNNSVKGNTGGDSRPQPAASEGAVTYEKLEHSKSEKPESGAGGKAASSRKKGYDPDLFFKVNGKLYQRLGKIGSGGSSEVHKVISSDCMIYALKKIKLKGRDYGTAYGFCQEIEYLNRLKGKSNIIQLVDYEVTDKTLLQDVMNGSVSNKDSRVKGDGYIYMVLEYGENDLAHMLAQKWRELDSSNAIMDENWLRFYWQQILLAVNTIHEERIVHSDLKPANFLLVRGSLKLIDFGIAKAIMSDTTNIQRDSQVGTLSYMSPEAFMCNEKDAEGNTIKCGRSSDIWSLGCILYQMVYGRTPFSEYKTFWAKFKVITDPNHKIEYEPLPNPWLLDLMKKCLVWDRNKRWRIPQLLQHPFLVPPVPPLASDNHAPTTSTLFQLIAESSANDEKTLALCSQLESMAMEPDSNSGMSREQLRRKVSTLCFQLGERLANL
ncbi:serine/threonine-protein kinase MPS1 isoform X2 [Andrographis paniculata]|uniref:serine/threonine-protein kinase MPS1 isoform X2 n=1 Tax=Andrographis paniculata TaxID=175694 RepID=UPI0021E779F1|nr:serine/threonine-protein kinase MPS1 isoform X2 [Andrographis paniculata]